MAATERDVRRQLWRCLRGQSQSGAGARKTEPEADGAAAGVWEEAGEHSASETLAAEFLQKAMDSKVRCSTARETRAELA